MASVTDWFGDEERTFLVRVGELRAIQEACGNKGPAELAHALARCVAVIRANPKATLFDLVSMGLGGWQVEYVRQPILKGMIAGGTPPRDAGKAVQTWIDDRGFQGLVENAPLALSLLIAGVSVPEHAQSGEPMPAETPPATEGPSTSELSTKPEAPLDGPKQTSTHPDSGSSPAPSEAGTRPRAERTRSRRPRPKSTTP